MIDARTINADAKHLGAALFYATHGIAVFPTNVPIHDEAGHCTGCTCEHYKRSEAYHESLIAKGRGIEFDPNYKCKQPGKCPACNWKEKSTTDEAQVRKWFGHPWSSVDVETGRTVRYIPNIGADCGKSNLLTVDRDEYKESYAGAGLLNCEDEETVTALTGGGGTHLFFDRQGLPYGNDTGELPAGLDIRGVGGYVIVAPSLHSTGNRYQWEIGYSPRDIALKPIPETLRTVLEAAHQQKQARSAAAAAITVNFATVAGDAPDLTRLDLSESTIDRIHNPAERGKRSESDAHVVTALCAAGATDDDVLAIFTHYPVGAAGKFAERGAEYLARTITNARAYLAEQEQKQRSNWTILEGARQWVRRADFSEVVPPELQAINGYRTNDTDKAMALACLAEFGRYGKLEGPLGAGQLSAVSGRSVQTCADAMRRIAPLFPCINEGTRKPDEARVYRLCDELRRLETVSPTGEKCEPFLIYATLPMDTHRAHDAFVRSMRPLDKDELAERIKQRLIDGKARPWATGDERRRVDATLPSAGPAALIVADALTEFGPMRRWELSVLTCKSKYAISRAVSRLVELEQAEDNDGLISLVDGWADHLNEITPQMPTAGSGLRRTIARLDRTIAQCTKELETASDDKRQWLHRRMERAKTQKLKIARAEGFTDKATSHAMDGNKSLTWWDVQKIYRRDEIHDEAKMNEAESRRRPEWELAKRAGELRDQGAGKQDAARTLQYAGYTVDESWAAVNRVWPDRLLPNVQIPAVPTEAWPLYQIADTMPESVRLAEIDAMRRFVATTEVPPVHLLGYLERLEAAA